MYTVKDLLIVCLVVAGATSCSSAKRSTTAAKPAGAPASRSSSPRFIEHISINNNGSATYNSTSQRSNFPSGDAAVAGSTVEMSVPLQFKYAILLDVPVETINDAKMFDFIESWYGAKYRYGGNEKSGVDCSGFSKIFVSEIYNINVPRTSATQFEQSKRISKDELQEGDLVFFRTSGRRRGISHVGIYLRNNKFVHASTSLGVTINDLDDAYYLSTYAGAGRIR